LTVKPFFPNFANFYMVAEMARCYGEAGRCEFTAELNRALAHAIELPGGFKIFNSGLPKKLSEF
jgi:hypothetical protein